MWAIETRELTKIFRTLIGKAITAVDGLNLQVPTGCVFGFLGPNGAGKTSTLNLLSGQLKQAFLRAQKLSLKTN